MKRRLSLRQIEAFKAVIDQGTVSGAAEILHLTQPSVSKMIANLEADAGLVLFDRRKGRLTPTQQGLRLYDEIDRVFQGVRQVENAIDVIRRDDQERLSIGVMPALSGLFTQKVTAGFLRRHPNTFCVVDVRSSQRIVEWLLTRKLDIGLIVSGVDFDNPHLVSESVGETPVVCILPVDHPLTSKVRIRPEDLDGVPFVSFDPDTNIGQRVAATLGAFPVDINVVLVAKQAPTLCAFVAAGHGVSLVHPLMIDGFGPKFEVRPFAPEISFDFKICRRKDSRLTTLIDGYTDAIRQTVRDGLAAVPTDRRRVGEGAARGGLEVSHSSGE